MTKFVNYLKTQGLSPGTVKRTPNTFILKLYDGETISYWNVTTTMFLDRTLLGQGKTMDDRFGGGSSRPNGTE